MGDFLEEKLYGWLIKGLVEAISTNTLLQINCIRISGFGVVFLGRFLYWPLLVLLSEKPKWGRAFGDGGLTKKQLFLQLKLSLA